MAGGLHDDSNDELHEINVTPFIDVMLVLLIIFTSSHQVVVGEATPSRQPPPGGVVPKADSC